jgi:uncharacterized ferredoxin-like protein
MAVQEVPEGKGGAGSESADDREPKDRAHAGAVRFLMALRMIGVDVSSARTVPTSGGRYGVHIGVFETEDLDKVSTAIETEAAVRARAVLLGEAISEVGTGEG